MPLPGNKLLHSQLRWVMIPKVSVLKPPAMRIKCLLIKPPRYGSPSGWTIPLNMASATCSQICQQAYSSMTPQRLWQNPQVRSSTIMNARLWQQTKNRTSCNNIISPISHKNYKRKSHYCNISSPISNKITIHKRKHN